MFGLFKRKDRSRQAWMIKGTYVGHGVSLFEPQHFDYTGTYLDLNDAMGALRTKLEAESSRYENAIPHYDDRSGWLEVPGKGIVVSLRLHEIRFS